MSDPWDDDKAETPTAPVVKAEPGAVALAKIGGSLDLLKVTIPNMVIKTEEDKAKALANRGDLKKVKTLIKEYTEDNIDPLNNQVKRLKAALKPFSDKLKELDGILEPAIGAWNTRELTAKREQQRKEKEAYDLEQKKAAAEITEAKKKGEPTPMVAVEKMAEPPPVVGKMKTKTDTVTESVNLKWMWWIDLLDGTEWDKKSRVTYKEIKGYSAQQTPLWCLDSVQINSAFNEHLQNCGLPHWIKTGERAVSRLT